MDKSESLSPVISVIVPIYNAEQSLITCVDSILKQSYTDFELILVNDGSTDDSGKICEKYAKKDARVKVYHISNGGASKARNFGIDHAKAEYICFVDADDFVGKDYLYLLVGMVRRYGVEIAVVREKFISGLEREVDDKWDWDNVELLSRENALQEVLLARGKIGITPWGKIFYRKLWDCIRFPEGVRYEDVITIPWILAQSEKVAIQPSIQYYYINNPNSLTHRTITEEEKDIIYNVKHLVEYIDQEFPRLHDAAIARMVSEHICYLYRLVDVPDYRTIYFELKNEYQVYWREALENHFVPNRHKIQLRMLFFSPLLYKYARKTANWMKSRGLLT